MKKAKMATVLLWAETIPEKTGFLIKTEEKDGLFKYSVMARRNSGEIEVCPSRKIEVGIRLVEELEAYFSAKFGAIMSGEFAREVENVLQRGGIIR